MPMYRNGYALLTLSLLGACNGDKGDEGTYGLSFAVNECARLGLEDTGKDVTADAGEDTAGLGCDLDGDGYAATDVGGTDCDDGDARTNPDATEVCDGADDDCDGTADDDCVADGDGDGFPDESDCDDTDPTVYPGAVERCDGKDSDCDHFTDEGCPGYDARTDPDE